MIDPISERLDFRDPPPDLNKPLVALWWIKKGGFKVGPEWAMAHDICVSFEGTPPFDLIHALLHWIEGDFGNSDYWYRRAGTRRQAPSVSAEWETILAGLVVGKGGKN